MDVPEFATKSDLILLCLLLNVINVTHFCVIFYIVTFNFFFLHARFARSIRIWFYSINWLYSFIIISTHCNLVNLFRNTSCFSLLHLCCDFQINLLLFVNSLWFPLRLFTVRLFFVGSLFLFRVDLLLDSFYNLQI